jgi:DHA2 family multidrug resistance protein
VNVALRQISGSIGATTSEIAWIITAYAISNVVIIPLSGMLSTLFGRKRYFTFSIALFTFASLMCGLSNSLWVMVAWRFVQGLGGGALLSTAQTILIDAFPPEKRGIGMALFGMGVALGPALGPVLGGIITDNISWHWIFFVNIPLGTFAVVASWLYIADQEGVSRKGPMDWWGIVFLVIGVGSLQYILEEGNAKDWFESSEIVWFTVAAALGLMAFIARELKTDNPAVKLSILKSPNLALGAMLNFVVGVVISISVFTFPLFTQIDLGWTATMSGMALMPGSILTAVGMIVVQKTLQKGINPKVLVFSGFVLTLIFSYWMHIQSIDSGWDSLFVPQLIRGFAVALFMIPIINLAIQGLSGADLGQGSGLSNMTRQLGTAVGIAVSNIRLTQVSAGFRNNLITNVSDYSQNATNTMNTMNGMFASTGLTAPEAQASTFRILEMSVQRQTTLLAYLDSFMVVGVVCLAALPLVFLMKHNKNAVVGEVAAH